uniref:DUF4430 domain-containing protein n=1 Tax=Musca domestica TaxID=7370 RepID=A0A1I8NA23_MUSDO
MTQQRNGQYWRWLFAIFMALYLPNFAMAREIDAKEVSNCDNVSYTYTIWIGSSVSQEFNIALTSPKNTNFFEAMNQAAKIDPRFDFKYKNTSWGHYVTEIAGKAEDVKNNIFWLLYNLPEPPNKNNKPGEEYMSPVGVDGLIVENGKNYLFWLRELNLSK